MDGLDLATPTEAGGLPAAAADVVGSPAA